jgi:hypothetical protein
MWNRDRRVADELLEPSDRVEVSVLDHVGGVDPAPQPGVEAQRHHPPQAGTIATDQLDDRLSIAGGDAGDEVGDLTRRWRHVTYLIEGILPAATRARERPTRILTTSALIDRRPA